MLESLRLRNFRIFWISSFCQAMAMGMEMMARGWLVLRLTDDSPFALSLVMISFSVPMTFISLIGGALADRIQRKHIILAAQGISVVMMALLATLDLNGMIRFWHMILIGAVNGSLMALIMPSRQALVADLVPSEMLMNAISLNSSGMNMTRVIGPALAGLLIVFIETSGVFYLISLAYLFSLLIMISVQTPNLEKKGPPTGIAADISTAMKYVINDPALRGIVITLFIPIFFGFSLVFLLPAWGREVMDMQPKGIGFLMMVMGAGSLMGTLILAALRSFKNRGTFLLLISILWGAAMTVFSLSRVYFTALPFLFLTGLMSGIFMSLHTTLMQVYSTREMRGRIMSIAMMSFGATPLSVLPFGALAENIGTPVALSLCGLLMICFVIIFVFAYPAFRKID